MEKRKIGVKTSLAYKEAVSYMKDFLKGLESGKIVVESGGEHVTLVPTDNVDIKVEAKTKMDKQKFSFEVSWCDPAQADLKISDTEPEPQAPAAEKTEARAEPEVPAAPEKKSGESGKPGKEEKKEKKGKAKAAKKKK